MPIAISQISKKEKKLSFYFGDEKPENKINFTYKPNAFTPAIQDKFSQITKEDSNSDLFLSAICELMVSWDIYDKPSEEGGKSIPFNIDSLELLKTVPYEVYQLLMKTIAEDQKPPLELEKGSLIG